MWYESLAYRKKRRIDKLCKQLKMGVVNYSAQGHTTQIQ